MEEGKTARQYRDEVKEEFRKKVEKIRKEVEEKKGEQIKKGLEKIEQLVGFEMVKMRVQFWLGGIVLGLFRLKQAITGLSDSELVRRQIEESLLKEKDEILSNIKKIVENLERGIDEVERQQVK